MSFHLLDAGDLGTGEVLAGPGSYDKAPDFLRCVQTCLGAGGR